VYCFVYGLFDGGVKFGTCFEISLMCFVACNLGTATVERVSLCVRGRKECEGKEKLGVSEGQNSSPSVQSYGSEE
jgi:hypothetical protein